MSLETLTAPDEGLLGRTSDGLKLRLSGPGCPGQLIELKKAKCTVGSGAGCTVSLWDNRPGGPRPGTPDCLIVRGAAQTLVRRFTSRTRLNGHDFSDALLKPGDRLSVGDYELDVLRPGAEERLPGAAPDSPRLRAEIERLENVLRGERAQWRSRHDRILLELGATQAELARLNAHHERLAVENRYWRETEARLASECQSARHQLRQERAKWQAEVQSRANELKQKSRDFDEAVDRAARLAADLALANLKIARHTDEVDRQKQQTAEVEAAAERLQCELADARAGIREERKLWQAELEHRLAELSQRSAQHAAACDEVARYEAELAQVRDELARIAAEAADQLAQARQQEATIERLRAELAQAHEKLQRHDLAAGENDDLRRELETTRQSLVEERSRWQEERQLHERQARADLAEIQSQNDELRSLLAELNDELERVRNAGPFEQPSSDETDDGQFCGAGVPPAIEAVETLPQTFMGSETPAGDLIAGETPAPQPASTDDLLARFTEQSEEEVAFQAPTSESPVSTTDLLSRFDMAVSHEEPAALPPEDDDSQPEPIAEIAAAPPAAHAGREDEESIDSYMAQLMARLGKPSYAPPREETTRAPRVEEAVRSTTPAAEPPVSRRPKFRDPAEIERRALPPERTTDLSAMRELANLNARAAIDAHQRRRMIESWITKALIMLMSLGVAGAEAYFGMEGNDTAYLFVLPCLIIGVFWGWQYLNMSRVLNRSRIAVASENAPPSAPSAAEEHQAA